MNSTCPACGTTLGVDGRFCHSCGARVPARVSPAARFQSPVAYTPQHLAQRILTSRSALEGEHKRVTVLFCDIADSTVLAERLGEEGMYELLNRFFDHALEEIHRYEGTVNQFLGDGLMAIFGAPLALEHHERHAVLAAIALRRRVTEHLQASARSVGLPLEIRLGVNTGTVVVGKIGDNLRMDYTAVGDTTHIASRLQSMATPGDLLISQDTFARIEDTIETMPVGPVDIKGKSAPLHIHRVLGARSLNVPGAVTEMRRRSQFVGRARELADLDEALEHAESGRGQAIGIVSEPGMGKSRLLREFRQRLASRDVGYLEGQCVSYGATIPYLPILDILRTTCRIADSDTPETTAGKLHAAVEGFGMDAAASTPYLLHLLGLKEQTGPLASLTPETIQIRTFEILRQLSLKASRRQPLVLVIEDLHWVDSASEDFIALMVETLAGAAILFVATYRPGYSPAWINKSYATQIALRPLSQASGLAIAEGVLESQGAPISLATELVTRAEGNPLFLEELARAASEHRAGDSVVPATLHGVLAARIDRLPETAKHLLQIASVIGREFSPTLLALLWKDDGSLDTELLRLRRLEFIYERTGVNEPLYVFKHALTREAAYGSLLTTRRRSYHRMVGEAMEQLQADRLDDVVELLAHHFGLSDADDKAVDYAIRASERAQRRWANTEALALSEAALERLRRMPETDANRLRTIDAVIKLAEVRFALGQHTMQLAALEQVTEVVAAIDDPPRRAAWHYWMGFLNSLTGGRRETSIAHCQEASAIAESAHLEVLGASAHTCLAQVYLVAGELRKAIETGERAFDVFERHGNRWWACRALSQLSPTANALGEWYRGLAYCRRALEHGIAMDDLRLKVSAFIRLASTQIQRGDWQTGLEHCDQAQALSPLQYDAAALRAIRGYGFIKAGRTAEGIAAIDEALPWYEKSHLRYTRSLFALWLGEGCTRAGRTADARRLLEEVLATSVELGYRHLEGVAHRLLGDCLYRTDVTAAAVHLGAAIDILQSVDARSELAKTWLTATTFPNSLVDAGRVPSVRNAALATLRDLGTVPDVSSMNAEDASSV